MRTLLYKCRISALIVACGLGHKSPQDDDSSDDVTKINISQDEKPEIIPKGLEILDRKDASKKIVFGCGKKGKTCNQKHDHSDAVTVDPSEYIEPDIVAGIENDVLWEKLKNESYEKITTEAIPRSLLTPSIEQHK